MLCAVYLPLWGVNKSRICGHIPKGLAHAFEVKLTLLMILLVLFHCEFHEAVGYLAQFLSYLHSILNTKMQFSLSNVVPGSAQGNVFTEHQCV